MNARLLLVALPLVALPLLLAACGPVQDGQGSPILIDVVSTATAPPMRSPTPFPATGSPGTAASSGAAVPSVEPVAEDDGLLAVLPEEVGGTPLRMEPQAFVGAAGDPAFASSIAAAAFFVAPGPADIVSGLVARPRAGAYSEAWFNDWRETYDDGACTQAGGVGGRAETSIGGRLVSITTCAGGMRVYHAWVKEQGVVVSLIAIGENRWGEQVMGALRP